MAGTISNHVHTINTDQVSKAYVDNGKGWTYVGDHTHTVYPYNPQPGRIITTPNTGTRIYEQTTFVVDYSAIVKQLQEEIARLKEELEELKYPDRDKLAEHYEID